MTEDWFGVNRPRRRLTPTGPDGRASAEDFVKALTAIRNERICLCPQFLRHECDGPVVKAHTVQKRGGGLALLQEEGHVLHLELDLAAVFYRDDLSPRPNREGWNEASTVRAFCAKHDASLFSAVDTQPFDGTAAQVFLLGYRAFCREVHRKLGLLSSLEAARQLTGGATPEAQRMVDLAKFSRLFVTEAELADFEAHKSAMDAVLQKGNFDSVKYYIVKLDRCPEVMCSGAFVPDFDFDGLAVQNVHSPSRADVVSFTLIGTAGGGGLAVFSWVLSRGAATRFVRSLHRLKPKLIPNALLALAFEYLENVYMKPSWWNGISPSAQEKLLKRCTSGVPINHGLANEPMAVSQGNRLRLKPSGPNVVEWRVLDRRTNIRGI